jgi:hypothetical protein
MMEQNWWVEIAKQVPALLLFVYVILHIVNRFLTHIDTMHKSFTTAHEATATKVSEATESAKVFQAAMTRDNHVMTERALAVIDKNTTLLGTNIHALERLQKSRA